MAPSAFVRMAMTLFRLIFPLTMGIADEMKGAQMILKLDFKMIFLALAFLSGSSYVANGHPSESPTHGPTEHQHFHCHHNQSCHSHSHDVGHH